MVMMRAQTNVHGKNIHHNRRKSKHRLPGHHQDPFDRLLVAQARRERMPILSVEEDIDKYDVEVIH
jgi:PIN domain nuclease of toxin-antitoxin system